MSKIDTKLLNLMHQLYELTGIEEKDFLDMINWFDEEEKKEIGYMLWERVKAEEWLFSRFMRKIKNIWNNIEEQKTKLEADQMLLNL